MFAGYIYETSVWQPVLKSPVLRKSLDWLAAYAENAEYGDHPLGNPDWYANIHEYSTLPEKDCLWENHKHTVDIQYMIAGREKILWGNVNKLGSPIRYIEEKDREEFKGLSINSGQVTMEPSMFTIFLPGDAHCPKIAVEKREILHKAVIKIPAILLEE